MRAYEIGSQQGLQSLRAVNRADLHPAPGEVVIRVLSVGLNHRDLLLLKGRYGALRPENRIPVSDGVGEILAIGEGVDGFTPGERVTSAHFVSWQRGSFDISYFGQDLGASQDGWLAEQIRVPASALVRVPADLSNDQVAALPAAGLTAWNALTHAAHLKAGDTVLTLGTGGVSIFALQLAKMHGARVAVTSSSDEKLRQLDALGADILINYRTDPDWSKALLTATGGQGASIVIETAGLATLGQSIAAAATNGHIILIGGLGGTTQVDLPNFSSTIIKNLTLRGVTSGSKEMFESLLAAVSLNSLQPVIHKRFSFNEVPEAYAYLDSGDHIGKIVIDVAR